ncbi:hypothetical protein AB0M92_17860 [Streptomyces sp. NPDC051582]|uniref:hypothetical protein n=1 Tax=Streptomyces sp. NPDC051582 TaxID=3155167 RepID=UPI003430D874
MRKRPGMYVGSTTERGLRRLVHERVEEARARHPDTVGVMLTADGGVRVADDGPYPGRGNGP